MPTLRLIDPLNPNKEIIQEMADLLRRGSLVVFPTETFYGLGAHALHAQALEKAYALKGRPRNLPLLCLLDGPGRLEMLVGAVDPRVEALMQAFWPGPLTLVLPALAGLPDPLLGPSGGVAVRWSSHPVAQALVEHLHAPIVGTSANRSGESPPTMIQDLSPLIRYGVAGILDGGTTQGKAPSTVVDCTRWPAKIVREGALSRDDLRPYLGE